MTEWLASLTDGFGPMVPVLAALFAFAESGLGLGSVLPGESLILALAVGMDAWHQKAVLLFAVAAGASAGDHVGYGLGRRLGTRLRETRAVRKIGIEHWDKAVDFVRRHGASAVVVSRLLPVIRTLVPAIAGVSELRYRQFLFASIAGSLIWAGLWVGAGSAVRWGFGMLAEGMGFVWILAAVGATVATVALVRRAVIRGRPQRSLARSR